MPEDVLADGESKPKDVLPDVNLAIGPAEENAQNDDPKTDAKEPAAAKHRDNSHQATSELLINDETAARTSAPVILRQSNVIPTEQISEESKQDEAPAEEQAPVKESHASANGSVKGRGPSNDAKSSLSE